MFRKLNSSLALLLVVLFVVSETRIAHSQTENLTSPFLNENNTPAMPQGLPQGFPDIRATITNNPAPGSIFMTDFSYTLKSINSFIMILDAKANTLITPITSSSPLGSTDFKPQPGGLMTFFDEKDSVFYGLDSNFTRVDTFGTRGNVDDHELRIFPNGDFAFFAPDSQIIDMSKLVDGGDPAAKVLFQILRVFDRSKNLKLEWKTREHFLVTDAIYENPKAKTIDATHVNSIDRDMDGNYIISVRNQSEVCKISATDGSFIWRWGGKNDQFTHTDLDTFSYQHNVRRLPNGNITMFDNGNVRLNSFTPYSRAVEYSIDEKAKKAKKVWEFRHSPDLYASAMGSVQRLADGNTLIGWGLADGTALTEVTPTNQVALEFSWGPSIYNYRVYKYTDDEIKAMRGQLAVVPNDKPTSITLEQNYPNPFSSYTIINFTTSTHTPLTLKVYDALGREVRTLFDGTVNAGNYSTKFKVDNLPDGIYNCMLATPSVSQSCRLIIVK